MASDAALDAAARRVWDYLQCGHALPPHASVILALGSDDPRVAERAADLFLEGRAPILLFSGGEGALTRGLYGKSEAAYFAGLAAERGVPSSSILIEGASTNTGENIRFSAALLAARGVTVSTLILVQKPYMERRTLATFEAQWPASVSAPRPSFVVTSPRITLEAYPTPALPLRHILATACGDLQRCAIYPARGFQSHQVIPQAVWEDLKSLIKGGCVSPQLIRVPGAREGSTDPGDYEGLGEASPPPPPSASACASAPSSSTSTLASPPLPR